MDQIQYYDGYKYQLAADYSIKVPITGFSTSNRYIRLVPDGTLTIREDYAWDGPSGPTADTPDSMRASLVHDALYQLMRDGSIPEATFRPIADEVFHQILLEDGMLPLRAALWYKGVRMFGEPYANPAQVKPVLTAP